MNTDSYIHQFTLLSVFNISRDLFGIEIIQKMLEMLSDRSTRAELLDSSSQMVIVLETGSYYQLLAIVSARRPAADPTCMHHVLRFLRVAIPRIP